MASEEVYVYEISESDEVSVTGYTATLSADQAKAVGETAVVTIEVGSNEDTTYNAFRYEVTYDTEKLTFVAPAEQEGVVVSENNGTIIVKGFGDDKTCGADNFVLSFTAKAIGEAKVTLVKANIDKSANANAQDAPEATILDAETVIGVGYIRKFVSPIGHSHHGYFIDPRHIGNTIHLWIAFHSITCLGYSLPSLPSSLTH